MRISIPIILNVDVVITIEIKAFFHKKGACVANASQLSLTGIVFIGFFNSILLWPWLHAAGITSLPSGRQHKLPRLFL
ncbi:MAG: hypothetical protein ACRCTP_07150, partial [Aeromonas popoffii]|uniref:hypothetical protein n=1 Tax=Aeromonas popoffii TaxID=70856 RepID=UPI003F2D3557